MPLPIVAIEAGSQELTADAPAAIVTSCARVLGLARCVAGGDALAPAARYLAVVVVVAEGRLRVELRSRLDESPRGNRDLAFASASLGLDHYNSAGLVVAALVADAEEASVAEAPPLPPAPPLTPRQRPRSPPALWARLSLSAVASPGFDFDPWRAGPSLKAAAGTHDGILYPVLTTRWLRARGQVLSDTISSALGLGARVIQLEDTLELDLEAAAVLDTLLVATDTEQGFRLRYGARLGVSSSLKLYRALHALAGVDATWLGNRAILELAGRRLGAEPRYLPGFELGFRLTF